jgi:deoxyadenosine/deoxycytidine kinase
VVEGVIGAGKTSLAKKLQKHFGGEIVFEEFEENPFLEDFYHDRRRFAFQTQMFFLLSRFNQQEKLRQTDLFQDYLFSDYFFSKDRIFASINLDEREMSLYDSIAKILERQIVQPDLIVFLNASVDRLMYNIKRRARPMEQNMEREYISQLADAYRKYFRTYQKSPLLIVESSSIDFINNFSDFEKILDAINNHREGVKYFAPEGAINVF